MYDCIFYIVDIVNKYLYLYKHTVKYDSCVHLENAERSLVAFLYTKGSAKGLKMLCFGPNELLFVTALLWPCYGCVCDGLLGLEKTLLWP